MRDTNKINKEKLQPAAGCEELILSIILDEEAPLDLAEIMKRANNKYNKEWKPQTVSTFLTRLRKKGYIDFYRKGRYCYYIAKISKEEYLHDEMIRLANTFTNGNIHELLDIAMIDDVSK